MRLCLVIAHCIVAQGWKAERWKASIGKVAGRALPCACSPLLLPASPPDHIEKRGHHLRIEMRAAQRAKIRDCLFFRPG